jgi:hypothetical protein
VRRKSAQDLPRQFRSVGDVVEKFIKERPYGHNDCFRCWVVARQNAPTAIARLADTPRPSIDLRPSRLDIEASRRHRTAPAGVYFRRSPCAKEICNPGKIC